jgi:aminopeptidase N
MGSATTSSMTPTTHFFSLLVAVAGLSCCTTPTDQPEEPSGNGTPTAVGGMGGADSGPGPSGSGGSGAGGSGSGGSGSGGCLDGAPFAEGALKEDLTLLASDAMAGRAPGTPQDLQARELIAERFDCLGLSPAASADSYHQPFVNSIGQSSGNVVALVPGSDPEVAAEIIVVGAHHDHLGIIDGEIYNGANDNASGVVAMLAVAQAVRERSSAPRRSIAFVAFGSEENELDGSYHFVDVTPPTGVPIDDIVHMVNLDMVGTYAVTGNVDVFGTYPGTPGLTVFQDLVDDYPSLEFSLGQSGGGWSDYDDFCEVGIPYIYFETWDTECYHQPCDDADRIDYVNLSTIARLASDIVTALADTDMDLVAARENVGCAE